MDEMDDMVPGCVQPHGSYSLLLSRRPWVVILLVFLVSTASLVALLVRGGPPNFGQSEKYFRTIGTEFSSQKQQFNALLDASTVARQYIHLSGIPGVVGSLEGAAEAGVWPQPQPPPPPQENNPPTPVSLYPLSAPSAPLASAPSSVKSVKPRSRRPIAFCRDLGRAAKDLVRFVFRATADSPSEKSGKSLLTLEYIQEMCHQEKTIRRLPAFQNNCQRVRRNCCRNWSLANLVAFFNQRPTCFDVTKEDVARTRILVDKCSLLYDKGTLHADCWQKGELQAACYDLPPQCRQYEVFLLFQFVLTLPPGRGAAALTVLPIEAGPAQLKDKVTLFQALMRMDSDLVHVVAAVFDIDAAMVPLALMQDLRWVVAALCMVLLVVLLYTSSFLLTLVTMVTITLSLFLGYAVYRLIVTVPDFPAPNLMAVMVAVAAGADDVFVLVSAWRRAKRDARDGRLEKLVSDMLRHAGVSVTVTSLSTAAAFLANLASTVAAVRCFAVYATSVVVINLFLCLTLVPAAIVVHDKHCRSNLSIIHTLSLWRKKIIRASQSGFQKYFAQAVIRARYFWLLMLMVLLCLSLVAVFHWPGFRLPINIESRPSPTFYSASHPFEKYRQVYSSQLGFELAVTRSANYTLSFVWGAVPDDLRHPLVPWSVSPLHADPHFDMTSPAAQMWLTEFCANLDAADFTPKYSDCPLHPSRMNSLTALAFDKAWCNQTGCCDAAVLPLERRHFEKCLYSYEQYRFQHSFTSLSSGTRYRHRSLVNFSAADAFSPKGLVVNVFSNGNMFASFATREKFWRHVQTWFRKQLENAPPGMTAGFVTTNLEQWDVERALASGLPWTLGLAVGAAAVTILLTTLNPLLAILAFICLASVVSGTVAFLIVATGWTAGLTESVIATAAIGLAVDFIMHYGVAFRLTVNVETRVERAGTALLLMGGPVTAAALTTLCAGVLVMPAQLMVYTQVGIFLTTVAVFAWTVASVAFPAMLACMGPSSTCCQLGCGSCGCGRVRACCTSPHRHVDKTVYTPQVSEFMETTSPGESDDLVNHTGNHLVPNNVYQYQQLMGDGNSSTTGLDFELEITRETEYDLVADDDGSSHIVSALKRANSTDL